MKHKLIATLCAGVFSLGLVSTANAALESRLGGQAFYDTDLDITWAANASISGLDTWDNQQAWVSGLTIGGISGWRLPATIQPDASCSTQTGGNGSGLGCTGSEMGHLFNVDGITAATPGVFSSVQSIIYWSGTEFASNSSDVTWLFNFSGGGQGTGIKNNNFYAWAVHSGDVGAVPVPGTIALMGLGLAGLLGFGRDQRRR